MSSLKNFYKISDIEPTKRVYNDSIKPRNSKYKNLSTGYLCKKTKKYRDIYGEFEIYWRKQM